VPPLNIFIDESGNFDFSPNGTRHFLLTAVSTTDCPDLFSGYYQLRHRIAATGLDLEELHATEDRQVVRNQVFDLLSEHVAHGCFSVDAVIAQKNKVNPAIREETVFYPRLLKILLSWVFRQRTDGGIDRVNVWAARIGTKKKRAAFERAIKSYLGNELNAELPYDIFIHSSSSHPMLQVADYCCWAINRKWKDGEVRHYSRIQRAVLTEFDVFRVGRKEYY
jgi:uncharacterized protein DUF3800